MYPKLETWPSGMEQAKLHTEGKTGVLKFTFAFTHLNWGLIGGDEISSIIQA